MQFTSSANLVGWKGWSKDGKNSLLVHFVDLKARQAEGNAPLTIFVPDALQQTVKALSMGARCTLVQEGDGKFNKLVSIVSEKVA